MYNQNCKRSGDEKNLHFSQEQLLSIQKIIVKEEKIVLKALLTSVEVPSFHENVENYFVDAAA